MSAATKWYVHSIQIFLRFIVQVIEELNTMMWYGTDDYATPPLDEPECGFTYAKCDRTMYYVGAFGALALITFIIVTVVLYKKR